MNSHPASERTTPTRVPPGTFEGSHSAPLPISGALLSSGAINPPTPSDLPPHFSCPRRKDKIPIASPAGTVSHPAPESTSPIVGSLDFSYPAKQSASPIVRPPGTFFCLAVSSTASTSQPPDFPVVNLASPIPESPGISQGPHKPRHPPLVRPLFLTRPIGARHPWNARRAFRIQPSKIRQPPECRWMPGGHTSADTRSRYVPAFSPGHLIGGTQSKTAG